MDLWHKLKVHPVNAGDEGWGHENHGDNGKDFDDAVLFNIDEAEEGILECFQALESEVAVINERANILEQDADSFAIVFGEALAANEEGEQALDIKEGFAQADNQLLEGLDAQDDTLLDVGVGEVFDFRGEAVDELREKLYMVGVGIYDLF